VTTDYYPLILSAVQGLDPHAPGEIRRALYERARAALISQLRSVQPSLSGTEITNERLALEAAVRRVEREAEEQSEQQLQASDEPASDPLAELARLIGQTDPFGRSAHAAPPPEAPHEEPSEVNLSAVHPLHRYGAQRPLDPFTMGEPVIPAGPPAWLEEVRKRAKNVGEEIFPSSALDRPPPPPIEVIPEQDLTSAIAFRPSRRGPLELLPDPPKDPHDPEQSQLYSRIRQQLQKLQADIPSQERAQIDDAVKDFLAQPASWQQVEFKKVLWLCGNALRNILAQHDAVKDSPEPHYSMLPPAVAEAMRRPVEAWNVFVLGDPDLVNLDAKRLGPQEQQSIVNDIETARPIVESAAADRNITTEQTAEVLDASLHAASTSADNINTRQGQQVVAGTFKNLITQLVRRAYLTCLAIGEPKTDDDRALAFEYQKGIARGAGTGLGKVAVGTTVAAAAIAVPYAVSFFEFVVQHAPAIKEYFAASQSPQLLQVIDTIEYIRRKVMSEGQ
jgi:hypothetical protein